MYLAWLIQTVLVNGSNSLWVTTRNLDCMKTRLSGSIQHAKKVVSDSLRLVDFAIGLVNYVFNLPDGQVMFFEEFE